MIYEPELLAYAAKMTIELSQPQEAETWFGAVKNFFDVISQRLKKPGATIGHIKGFLDLAGESYCYFSNVGNAAGTHCDNAHPVTPAQKGELDFNVLLYGWEEKEVETQVAAAVADLGQQLNGQCHVQNLSK